MGYLQVFLYLQLLDFMTTMVGLRMGGAEVSPFVHWLTLLGPATGVALSKIVAFLLGGICLWFRKERVIQWVNYFFAALVVWNLSQILKVLVYGRTPGSAPVGLVLARLQFVALRAPAPLPGSGRLPATRVARSSRGFPRSR